MDLVEMLAALCLESDGQEPDAASQCMDSFEKICKAFQGFYDMCVDFASEFKVVEDWWKNAAPKIYETVKNLNVSGYTEEEKEALISSYKKWGAYAWTMSAEQPANVFHIPPMSMEDADKQMRTYFTLSNMEKMKEELVESGVSTQDLEEAYFCYQNKKYKSCCLLLFGLIDNKLINYGYYGSKMRKTGGGAIVELKTEKEAIFNERIFLTYLWFENIMETLSTLFKNGNDFQNEPNCVNRNYISHGMSERNVTDIDCFKVWSALYSLVILLPEMEEIVG
jgi:hypothetical protein